MEDSLLTNLIKSAYQHAETRTGRIFHTDTRTLVLDGFGTGTGAIELPWTPMQSVDSLEYMDLNGETQALSSPPLRLDTRQLYPLLMPQWGTEWPATIAEPESVTITATVGYPDDELPNDVRCALLLIIGHLYANRESVVIGTISSELPMGVSMLLDPYKIHRIG